MTSMLLMQLVCVRWQVSVLLMKHTSNLLEYHLLQQDQPQSKLLMTAKNFRR